MFWGMTHTDNLAAEIRAEMARQRITSAEMADRVGMAAATFSRALNGDRPLSFDELFTFADALGVTGTELFHRATSRSAA